jgi:hypothetical protein
MNMEHKALFGRVTNKLDEVVNEDFIKSTKTEKGNTQISERVVIEKIREVLLSLEITFEEAGSQQSKDFRNVGGIGLNIEIKKTDNPVIYFNDTCPTKDIYYVVFFTGKEYKRTPEKNILPKLLYINGEEFIKDSPWIHEYIEQLTILKDKYARGENKKRLAGIMEVYPRPTFKANISKFLKNNELIVHETEAEVEEKTDVDTVVEAEEKTIEHDGNKENEDEDLDEDEFTCQECSTVQGKNNCELCDVEDVCEECYGEGGDYGPGEIWVCHECLPTCLECEAPLYTAGDECCGKGRSDEEEEEVFGMDNKQVEYLIKEEASEAVEEVEDDGDCRYVTCELCDTHVDCYNDNINIVYKGGDSVNNPYEELVLCTMCFQDMKDELIQQDYLCDDWDIEEEEPEEEEPEEDEFKCPSCKLVQSNNWCFTCDTHNSCQSCVGDGGDDNTEGHEEWVCQKCFDKQPEIKDETYEYEYESGEEEEPDKEETSSFKDSLHDDKEETVKLCINIDCERYPPDWDSEEDTKETYQVGQWQKCCLCDGYFDDNGSGDILYIQEEPNNQEAGCSLCGKSDDVVQMKGSGQYLCGNACDEDEDTEED